jgi:hypothetical protein
MQSRMIFYYRGLSSKRKSLLHTDLYPFDLMADGEQPSIAERWIAVLQNSLYLGLVVHVLAIHPVTNIPAGETVFFQLRTTGTFSV